MKASDFEYAIKRDFLVDSPGVGFFTNIVGADEFSKTKKGEISGITTDDATGKITIKLVKPQGDFQNILATIFAAPVPAERRRRISRRRRSRRRARTMIQSYTPNRQFVLVRNPNFEPTDNVPATNPDKMTFKIVEDDSAALQQVINGQADYDFHPIPVDRLADVQQKYGDQLKIYTPANTYYYFMNNRLPPFDKLAVRQGGELRDRPQRARSPLRRSRDADGEHPAADVSAVQEAHALPATTSQKAKQLIQQAGVDGHGPSRSGDRTARRRKKPVEYLHGRPEQDRLQGEARRSSTRRSTGRRSATRRRRRRSASPTGSRTTRIRSTGSTCS